MALGTTQITFKTTTERQSLHTVTAEGVRSQLNPPFPSQLPPRRRSPGCDCAQPRSFCNQHYYLLTLLGNISLFLYFLPLYTPFSH